MGAFASLVQLLQQGLDMRGIIDVFVGQISHNDLSSAGVNANRQFAPSAAFVPFGAFQTAIRPAPRSFRSVLSTIK